MVFTITFVVNTLVYRCLRGDGKHILPSPLHHLTITFSCFLTFYHAYSFVFY